MELFMAPRIVAAAVLSALLMFFWGFVYWGPVLDMTARLMSKLPEATELDVLAPLRSGKIASGMYVYPGPLENAHDPAAQEEWTEQVEAGPIIHMAYRQDGVSPMDPKMFAQGLAHSFVISLLCGCLLATVVHGLPTFASRVGVLFLVSDIAANWTNVGSVIWWGHPYSYAGGQILYETVAGLLMALVTAAIVRPPAQVRAQAAKAAA
jgi:hypothetical protein